MGGTFFATFVEKSKEPFAITPPGSNLNPLQYNTAAGASLALFLSPPLPPLLVI
jgi:hypothetical protein